MSGGSYDYLCGASGDDVLSGVKNEVLRRMADRLTPLCPEAAVQTEQIIVVCAMMRTRIEARLELLRDLWQAVEWRDSGDTDDSRLLEAIRKWRHDVLGEDEQLEPPDNAGEVR